MYRTVWFIGVIAGIFAGGYFLDSMHRPDYVEGAIGLVIGFLVWGAIYKGFWLLDLTLSGWNRTGFGDYDHVRGYQSAEFNGRVVSFWHKDFPTFYSLTQWLKANDPNY